MLVVTLSPSMILASQGENHSTESDIDLKFLAPVARFGSGSLSQSEAFISRNLLQYQIRIPKHYQITISIPGHHSTVSSPNNFISEAPESYDGRLATIL